MNTKSLIAIFAMFALLFAGVAMADSADAGTSVEAPSEDTSGAEDGADAGVDDGAETTTPTTPATPTTPTVPAVSSYSVTYIVNGMNYTVQNGSSNVVVLKDLAGLGAVTPAGKTFKNWTTSDTNYAAGSTYIIPIDTANVKFTAVVVDTVYTATFKAFDGSVIGIPTTGTSAAPADLATVAAGLNVAREGYIFAGWMAEGATEAIPSEKLPALTEDVVYTATYTIDYVINFVDGDKTLSYNVSSAKVPAKAERTGFTFLGWFVGTEQIADPVAHSKTVTADTTYTAKWEPVNVYVTFQAGDNVFEAVPVLYGNTVMVPALPEGYTAWDFDFDTPITEDITIVAVPAAPAEPTGLDDPVIMTLVIILGIIVCAGFVGIGVLKKKGKIVIGRAPKSEGENKP